LQNAETTTNNNIADILEKTNVPKYEYKNLKKYLPKINSIDYNNEYNHIKNKNTNCDHIFKFIINHLAYFIVTIAEYSENSEQNYIKPLCLEFSKFIITNIVKNQKLLSKPLNFVWKYFLENDDEYIDETEQIADLGEDIEPRDAEDNIFSSENIDYDMSEDNEGDNFTDIDF